MRDKIVKIFLERKKKGILKEYDPNNMPIPQGSDDFRQHTLQKPILTGYSRNQP